MMVMLLMLALSSGILDCEVTNVAHSATVICDDGTSLIIPLTEWGAFVGWKETPVTGLMLKAVRDEEGNLHPVADCETRTREAMVAYCGGMYCKPPINSLTPDDCR